MVWRYFQAWSEYQQNPRSRAIAKVLVFSYVIAGEGIRNTNAPGWCCVCSHHHSRATFSNILSEQDIKFRLSYSTETFIQQKPSKMPLVVPGITPQGGDKSKTEEWSNKLVGKKLGEGSDATVCLSFCSPAFAVQELLTDASRHSQGPSYQRKLVLSSRARWWRRISILKGELYHIMLALEQNWCWIP